MIHCTFVHLPQHIIPRGVFAAHLAKGCSNQHAYNRCEQLP